MIVVYEFQSRTNRNHLIRYHSVTSANNLLSSSSLCLDAAVRSVFRKGADLWMRDTCIDFVESSIGMMMIWRRQKESYRMMILQHQTEFAYSWKMDVGHMLEDVEVNKICRWVAAVNRYELSTFRYQIREEAWWVRSTHHARFLRYEDTSKWYCMMCIMRKVSKWRGG